LTCGRIEVASDIITPGASDMTQAGWFFRCASCPVGRSREVLSEIGILCQLVLGSAFLRDQVHACQMMTEVHTVSIVPKKMYEGNICSCQAPVARG
jgi:hypothetical protein